MNSRLVISLLAFVICVGLVPFGPTPVAAQRGAWDCSAQPTGGEAGKATPPSTSMPGGGFPRGGGELTVFAAASLSDAFEAIERDLEVANPDLSITYNFGGSQALVTQLEEGAEADVFASANVAQMAAATEAELIAGDAVPFVRNRLAIVTPANNPAGIESPADLGTDGILLVLAQPEVPAGRYARESVCKMGTDVETYGTGFTDRVAANVVSEEEDVRDVLTKVALGEADAGIVYVSDATTAADQVQVIDIPDEVNAVAAYPIAALAGGDEELASAFIAYLLSDEGQAHLASFGFETVE
ncbi:MAG: molybdate ABC transporter substrate-binding protein [Chloroflexi bacterium]|nr:molybdate ABC transporter substrate-binding protein [Chloroflexota bacterium]